MIFNKINYLLIFIISYITTYLSIPKVKTLGSYLKIIEQPKDRGQKKVPMIRSGGVSMFLSYIAVITFLYLLEKINFIDINSFITISKILLFCFSFFLIGLLDDLFQLSPWTKLISQIVGASVICSTGLFSNLVQMPNILGNETINLPISIAIILNIIFVVSLINSINWLDGLDGLASGYVGIVSLGFLILGISSNNSIVSIIAMINLGFCFGFLRYNFYPAQIFMGDCGSYLLGSNLSLMSIFLYLNNQSFLNLVSIFLLLIYPLFDMMKVIIKRIINKSSPLFPDREHLHHILIDNGISDSNSVLILYMLTCLTTILSISISNNYFALLLIPYSLLTLYFYKNKNLTF